MDDNDDLRSVLALMPTAAPASERFWTDLHRLLLVEADQPMPEMSAGRVVELTARPERLRRNRLMLVAVAAVVVLVIAVLARTSRREVVTPTGPAAPTSTDQPAETSRAAPTTNNDSIATATTAPTTVTPTLPAAQRSSSAITDPHAIDLDPFLVGAPVWPTEPNGPFTVFDMTSVPAGWTVGETGGGTSIPGFGRAPTWTWHASVISPDGTQYIMGLAQDDGRGSDPFGTPIPVQVRGHDGVVDSTRLRWDESDSVIGSMNAFDTGDHLDDELVFLDSLSTVTIDHLTSPGIADTAVTAPPSSLLQLRGSIAGNRWWAQIRTAPPLSVTVGSDGWGSGGGTGAGNRPPPP